MQAARLHAWRCMDDSSDGGLQRPMRRVRRRAASARSKRAFASRAIRLSTSMTLLLLLLLAGVSVRQPRRRWQVEAEAEAAGEAEAVAADAINPPRVQSVERRATQQHESEHVVAKEGASADVRLLLCSREEWRGLACCAGGAQLPVSPAFLLLSLVPGESCECGSPALGVRVVRVGWRGRERQQQSPQAARLTASAGAGDREERAHRSTTLGACSSSGSHREHAAEARLFQQERGSSCMDARTENARRHKRARHAAAAEACAQREEADGWLWPDAAADAAAGVLRCRH